MALGPAPSHFVSKNEVIKHHPRHHGQLQGSLKGVTIQVILYEAEFMQYMGENFCKCKGEVRITSASYKIAEIFMISTNRTHSARITAMRCQAI